MGLQEDSSRRQRPLAWLLPFLIVGVVAGTISGVIVGVVVDRSRSGSDLASQPQDGETSAVRPDPSGQQIAETVAFVLPSVVTVVNRQPERTDELGRIIGSIAVGSGFIVDERGYIVTNEHVIHEPGRLTVVLSTGEEREAELVSHDAPFTDLAVLKIAPGGLTPIRFGDSDQLQLGQTVIAAGTALFEYRNSVTVGVVSGLQRRWLRLGVFTEDLIQTDAAVNAGNSGGPLVTLNGEVVGITTNVVRRLGSIDTVLGVAFAISSKTMEPIIQSIIDQGEFPRPYFGIDHQNIDLELVRQANLGVNEGALVTRVFSSGPAAAAGILAGDILLSLDETEITDATPFINALSGFGIDQTIEVKVWRSGRLVALTVELTPR